MGSTQDLLDHHLDCFGRGDLAGIGNVDWRPDRSGRRTGWQFLR
jgi:hypothetical protein